jgi:hypothetical protein
MSAPLSVEARPALWPALASRPDAALDSQTQLSFLSVEAYRLAPDGNYDALTDVQRRGMTDGLS